MDQEEGPVHRGPHGGTDGWSGDTSPKLALPGAPVRNSSPRWHKKREEAKGVFTRGDSGQRGMDFVRR
jgi:hypothetical protein